MAKPQGPEVRDVETRRMNFLRITLFSEEAELLSDAAELSDVPLATWARSTLLQAARAVKRAHDKG
jgi:hypothetical protein